LASAKKKARTRRRAVEVVSGPPIAALVPMGKSVSVKIVKASADEIVYTLSDGTRLRLKPIVASVDRSLEKYNALGEPLYQINAGMFLQTIVTKKLMRKVKPQ
jgi:hypothetical protein